MSDAFRFETFVDAHSNIFNEYLSSVVAKLSMLNSTFLYPYSYFLILPFQYY